MESVLPICRVCLNASKDLIDFQELFECDECYSEEKSEMSYLECLRLCTNILIAEDDGGPQCLCNGCATELELVYKFLQKVKYSQDFLEESCGKNYSNIEQVEHTEICIEAYDGNDIVSCLAVKFWSDKLLLVKPNRPRDIIVLV